MICFEEYIGNIDSVPEGAKSIADSSTCTVRGFLFVCLEPEPEAEPEQRNDVRFV